MPPRKHFVQIGQRFGRAALRRRAIRARYTITGKLEGARFRVLSWLLNRYATPAMRHAALLLGYEMALGRGQEDLLFGPLHEYSLGNELGGVVRYGDDAERAGAIETIRLEQSLFKPPSRRGRVLTAGGAR